MHMYMQDGGVIWIALDFGAAWNLVASFLVVINTP